MKPPTATTVLIVAFVWIGLTGCKNEPPPPPVKPSTTASTSASPELVVPQPPAPGKNTRPEPLKVAVEWTDPAGWEKTGRTSPMRAATYKVPLAKGEEGQAEMAVFYFGPGQGGDVEGNVQRWASQFGKTAEEVQRSNREVNGLKQHVVEIEKGDYSSDMMGGGGKKVADQAMLAAIVQAPSGSYFFKLTGPHQSVSAQRAAFFALLDSIKTRD